MTLGMNACVETDGLKGDKNATSGVFRRTVRYCRKLWMS